MTVRLASHSYGKSRVRLTKVSRHADRHELKELSIDVSLEGEFDASYLEGDNRSIVATDSMKNTVYVLAKSHALENIESFAISLAEHFTSSYSHVSRADVAIREDHWQRIRVDGSEHPHAFLRGSNEVRTANAVCDQAGTRVFGGIDDLLLLKTTDSTFAGFVRDRYTTLPEVFDRIFATQVAARWSYLPAEVAWNECFARIRNILLEVFATHHSLAVQQTLYAMGEAVLNAMPEIGAIELTMPNKHRVPVNLAPFGLENENDVFIPTEEPFGLITAQLERGSNQ